MDRRVVERLRCPVCGEPLGEVAAGALRCPRRHSFDIARQGYVNLLAGRAPHGGDTTEMVAARSDFLSAGHYDLISAALADAGTRVTEEAAAPHLGSPTGAAGAYPLVVDAGAGTGRHLAAVLAAVPAAIGLALDVSKPALRRAARAHPRITAAVADTWQRLPLADASTALLLNVFAPRNGAEFHRVLAPTGRLLVVTPVVDHLTELVDTLGLLRVDPAKADRVATGLGGHFVEESHTEHRQELSLAGPEVTTLVGMGPSAWHTAPDGLAARITALGEPVRATVAVRLGVYRPRPRS
ncbi:putative RNA methyltransferase [Micromonospora craniellae]|uniref:23S rRNA methyltransferase n=1 Tax=Micromonospora craniellae TaxID=2294034 RepID=A0A372FYM2_9ACTN|nr:methyltransferase domain-containing protein [Micromonospora craniellae]QOC93723.1 23S rRNA methyltransferase [Micromonospora craniellae]RFS45724.1 23S rRNA methyltransferase [Micromonospora craniellae]